MTRDQFKNAYSNARSDYAFAMRMLFLSEKRVICAVFNNQRPGLDRLAMRAARAKLFAQHGESPLKALTNEFLHAGKLDANDLRRIG